MEKSEIGNFCIIGFPDDLGVKNVNGRMGASLGPKGFLDQFLRLKGRNPVLEQLKEAILVKMTSDIEVNHETARAEVMRRQTQSSKKDVLVVVGGGHDYAYPWIRAIAEARMTTKSKNWRIACINIDAHFDLREFKTQMTSGSPFRKLIDEKSLNPAHFVEFGIQAHCNNAELFDYAKKVKIKVIPFEKLRNGRAVQEFKKCLNQLRKSSDEILISLDLDALSLAFCPGVSAPQAEGLSASEVFQMLEYAGSDKKVTSLGIFELAPPLDFQDITSRTAAQATWHFLNAKFFRNRK